MIMVCAETEKCFQRMHAAMGDKLPQTSNLLPSICAVVLKEVGQLSFQELNDHMCDTTPDNNQ